MYFSCEEKYWRMCYIYIFTAIEILLMEKIDLLHKIQNIKKCRKERFVESYAQIEDASTDMSDFSDQTNKQTK